MDAATFHNTVGNLVAAYKVAIESLYARIAQLEDENRQLKAAKKIEEARPNGS